MSMSFFLWSLAAVFLVMLLFFLGDVVRWWLDERRLETYARSDAELLAYPALIRELEGVDEDAQAR